MTITANELKTKGVSSLEATVEANGCAIITIHGKDKYAVLKIDDYNKLRELELDLAIKESLEEIKEGKAYSDGIEEHMKRVLNG
jgi:PHD/YefM family antitoxin component YafN of YafNO toxin-antitoxin module